MSILIKKGTIVTADTTFVGDILCEGERITAVAPELSAPSGCEVIDAHGKYVFPGFVDPHTHIHLPFMGTYAKDSYATATQGALCGGTTTLIDFVIPNPGQDPLEALEIWQGKADHLACHDYTFHMAVTHYNERVEAQLRRIVQEHGITSFKVFLAYKGALGLDDEGLWNTLSLAKELGVLTTAHCENADLVASLQAKLIAEGKTGPEYHYESRPPMVEAEGTRHLCTFARLIGAPIYIVHLSCQEALEQAAIAKTKGTQVWIETLIQYLLLDKSDAERPDFEGAKYVMSPPLRDKSTQELLWTALENGLISTLATDHAPFDTTQKEMGRDNFCLIPNGIPSLEDRVRLLYTYGVCEGRLSLNRFVEVASTQAAKLFGLFPRKGCIQIGADADLVVYDPTSTQTLSAKTQHVNVDYNAFEGMKVKGHCHIVTVRGKIQVRDGAFIGEKGRGRFLARTPQHSLSKAEEALVL